MARTDKRGGDVLGLGGPSSSSIEGHASTADDATARQTDEAKRRRRMNEGADEVTPSPADVPRTSGGATGIDMGSGGEGTDLE